MHELSIMQALFDQLDSIALRHGPCRVRRVAVEMGDLSNVVPVLLQEAFQAFRKAEPLLEEATLEIRRLPLTVQCRECGARSEVELRRFCCRQCRSRKLKVIQGDELLLRDVELELEDQEALHG